MQHTNGSLKNTWHQIFTAVLGGNKYARKPLPGPGAENLAFLTLALPEFTPIGPGNANRFQLLNLQPVTYIPHLIGVQGIGGLLSGQIYGTPLFTQASPSETPQPVVIVTPQQGNG